MYHHRGRIASFTQKERGGVFFFQVVVVGKEYAHTRELLTLRASHRMQRREREEKKRFSSSASVLPLLCIIITI